MSKAKVVATQPTNHFKHNFSQYPTSEKEKKEMKNVPYVSSIVGNLMYTMVCTRLIIAHTLRVISQFLSKQ